MSNERNLFLCLVSLTIKSKVLKFTEIKKPEKNCKTYLCVSHNVYIVLDNKIVTGKINDALCLSFWFEEEKNVWILSSFHRNHDRKKYSFKNLTVAGIITCTTDFIGKQWWTLEDCRPTKKTSTIINNYLYCSYKI